jgi:hypothetical protein
MPLGRMGCGNILEGGRVQSDRMRRATIWMALAFLAALGAAQVIVTADDEADEPFDAKVARLRAGQPVGVRLEVKLLDGHNAFRLGEPIPMRLEFSDARWIRAWTRPHDAEWDWVVADSPDGGEFSDALDGLLAVDMAPGPLCRRYGVPGGPFVIDTHLNEWLRFNRPGTFRFFVRSLRGRRGEVVSNVVSVRILPAAEDGAWDRLMWEWENGDRKEAALGIRYLGTRQAMEFMARHLDEAEGFRDGLAASPPLQTLRALAKVDDTLGVRPAQILRLLAPFHLSYGPTQDRKPGWRRDVRDEISQAYRAGFMALNEWIEPSSR